MTHRKVLRPSDREAPSTAVRTWTAHGVPPSLLARVPDMTHCACCMGDSGMSATELRWAVLTIACALLAAAFPGVPLACVLFAVCVGIGLVAISVAAGGAPSSSSGSGRADVVCAPEFAPE